NGCATIIDMSNGEPTIMAGDDYDIPSATPFVLAADASDPNGDPLTYCWEQYDNEAGENMPPLATNTQGPMFRSFDPTSSPDRYFPRLNDLVNNVDPTWETLPETNRDMDFRVTVRDFDGTYGCTIEDNITLSVDASAGPFLVTEPNTNVTWFESSQATVTWDVAGTNSAPISCSDVDILLSYDGGFTYPVVLQGSTANDGSENITVPNGTSTTARVMVRCSDNVFFDISNVNFEIDGASAPDFTITYNDGAVQACEGTNGSLDFVVNTASIAGFNDPITLAAISSPVGVNVGFSENPVNPGDAVTITVSNFSSLAAGNYVVTVEGSSTSGDKTVDLPFVLIDAADAPNLTFPIDGATDVDIFPSLNWDLSANADNYFIEVSDVISFSNIVASGNSTETRFGVTTALQAETVYYWRVTASNAECGSGSTSAVFSFETQPCYYYTFSGNVPINAGAPDDYTSTLAIPNGGNVVDLDVMNLDITHTWVGDLQVQLESPQGTTRTLFTYGCGSADDVLLSFDDESSTALGCPRNTGAKVIPEQSLDAFDGQPFGGTWTLLIRDNENQDGGSLNEWNLKICTNNFVGVPVEWVSFTATAKQRQAELLWQTANEENNAGFDIERRAEHETDFRSIGWVDATSLARDINNYSYYDNDLKPGTTYYYRLRQVDYDGDFDYSEIRSVKIEGQEPQWEFFPNPTYDQVQLSLWNVAEGATITIVNTQGQQVQQISGLSTGTQVLDLSTQPDGVYWIQLKTGPWTYTERIVKL
ncbi:MAG: proprotein convertase P-domain-containing protein, partial [Bacteroidota bacterium]